PLHDGPAAAHGVRGGVCRAPADAGEPPGRRERYPRIPEAPPVTRGTLGLRCLLTLLMPGLWSTARAQAPIPDIRPSATVKSIGFRFTNGESFNESELGGVLALKGRGSFYR